jgi:hypothetical protein
MSLDPSGKTPTLTSSEKVDRPAREIAAGFLFAEIHQSDGGACFRRSHPSERACLSAASRVAVRTLITSLLADARERAGRAAYRQRRPAAL